MGFKQWRRKKREGSRWNESKDGGWFSKPPPVPVISYDSVPNWERRFCSQMSWKDFCYKKQVTDIYENVLDWDDSAGKEAFDNAKTRYWAEMNGLPCNIPAPDPDMYINQIDYDAPLDRQLYEDLYKMPPPPPPQQAVNPDLCLITPTGWDAVYPDPTPKIPEFIFVPLTVPYHSNDNFAPIPPTGRHDKERFDSINPPTAFNHTANNVAPIVPTGWGNEDGHHSINSASIVPTGWGDKEDSYSTHARVLPEIKSNGAFSGNGGNFSSQKHHHKTNAWSRGGGVSFKHANQRWSEQVEETDISFGSKHKNQRHAAGGSSFVSKPANQRCNGQVYEMDKYAKEQYFWHHGTSFERGLSTGFHGGDSTLC